jgi:hypothetical protein
MLPSVICELVFLVLSFFINYRILTEIKTGSIKS